MELQSMIRNRRWMYDTAIIAGIILTLDILISLFVPSWFLLGHRSATDAGSPMFNYDVSYHHDFHANIGPGTISWGLQTDRFSLRTGRCAPSDPVSEKNHSVFVIGDSMTAGWGLPYDKTFAGLMACALRDKGFAVWNLAVGSYSPIIYYRKILAVADKLSIHPTEIFVFLDISDVQDDAEVYEEKDGRVIIHPIDVGAKLNEPYVINKSSSW